MGVQTTRPEAGGYGLTQAPSFINRVMVQLANAAWNWGTYLSGGSQSHNNMPPYLVVNIYIRNE